MSPARRAFAVAVACGALALPVAAARAEPGDAGLDVDAGAQPFRGGGWIRAGDPDPPAVATPDPCAELEARMARRRRWLEARRQEQFEKGGPPDPGRGIPNMIGLWCAAHPDDEECGLGNVVLEVDASEVAWNPANTPEDLDAHVILMKRQLRACRERRTR